MPTTFSDLDLLPSLQATLAEGGFTTLTDVQARVLPELLAGRSVTAISATGSGKTFSYLLPILHRLKKLEEGGNPVVLAGEPRALVIVPTRELGEQVTRVFKTFTHATRLRVRSVLGGPKARRNKAALAGMFEVLIATPGRLEAMLEAELVSLDAIRFLVLDEADQLLDPSFGPRVLKIAARCATWRQLGLFSATMPDAARALVADVFHDNVFVETDSSQQLPSGLKTQHIDVPDGVRSVVLARVIAEPIRGGTILFANTRKQADRIVAFLREGGRSCAAIRGEMDPVERRQNLRAFRQRDLEFLVSTDMAARGLDVAHVARVINVHLPKTMEAYLHRVGRTARAGKGGLVINLVTPRDAPLLKDLGDGHQAPTYTGPKHRRRR